MILLGATQAFAQSDSKKAWGCLWVEKNDPGEKLLMWCVLEDGLSQIPCFAIDANANEPVKDIKPWVVVAASDVTERLAANSGLCPLLPANIPPVDTIRDQTH
jgi:hypothetical protein